MKHKTGWLQREFVQYSRPHNGHAPKPVWLLSRSPAGLRGGSFAGAPAKPVWKPPGKGQRVRIIENYSRKLFKISKLYKEFRTLGYIFWICFHIILFYIIFILFSGSNESHA